MTPTVLWLIGGAACIAIEMFGVPGIGFLFAGIGALMVGGGIELGVLAGDNFTIQLLVFVAISCISAALLWKRLKAARKPSYNNIVGTEAVVADGGLSGRQEGQVKWSGTLMRARLMEDARVDVVSSGTVVIVKHVEGNLLYVVPRDR